MNSSELERWMVDYEHADGDPQHAVLSWLSTDPTKDLPEVGTELVRLSECEQLAAAAERRAIEAEGRLGEAARLVDGAFTNLKMLKAEERLGDVPLKDFREITEGQLEPAIRQLRTPAPVEGGAQVTITLDREDAEAIQTALATVGDAELASPVSAALQRQENPDAA